MKKLLKKVVINSKTNKNNIISYEKWKKDMKEVKRISKYSDGSIVIEYI